MSLDKNSSRKEVLSHIKEEPIYFLCNFSDKPWAQPYIDDAAKRAAKEDPFRLLHYFSNKPWAQPYIDEAAMEVAKKRPLDFLDYFPDKPWAQPYIDKAAKELAKKYPKYFLEERAGRFPQGIDTALFALGGKNGSV